MADYKNTLNLPETIFPMKANLAEREPHRLENWKKTKLYEEIQKVRANAPSFILHDGPPYANGHLHCGHALNKILKDMVIKFKTLNGMRAPFVPGWDCHGLPIELHVEKKTGRSGHKLSHAEFRKACRTYAGSQIEIQKAEFERLGVLGDWQHPYATYDYSYEANVIRALSKIIENGHLEQGFKPVHWCIDCRSALAEAELEYEDKTSPSIDIAFFAEDDSSILSLFKKESELKPVIIPVWTTTPWTLPANEALSVNPKLSYDLLDVGSRYMVVGSELSATVMSRYGIETYKNAGQIEGIRLQGQRFKHPFFEKTVPVIYGDHVTMDVGTGAVHTAPAHGPEDYEVGQQFHLPFINPVLANGCYKDDVPFFAGMRVLDANSAVIEKLKEKETLLHAETLTHSYPHCWRHKTPTLFLATPQWFVSMDKNGLRDALIQAVEGVTWVPGWGRQRILNMIKTRPDWCISRQRTWGTPIPLFVHHETRALHPDTLNLLEAVAKRVEAGGIDAWFDLKPEELLGEEGAQYEKITDTLDVWFDAGVSHFAVLATNENLSVPADMYLEGSDQHRGWFNSSLTTSVAMCGKAPFRTVLTHGYTVDSEGKKLSKSKGNYVALDKLLNQYGADVLRLWVASSDYHNEVSISEEIVRRVSDMYRRIRNTARFLLANLNDFNKDTDMVAEDQLVELDAWIILEARRIQEEIIEAANAYQFHVVSQKIHHFCSISLSSFYLDVIKDRQYTTPKNSLARRSCQTAMYHILSAMTRWLLPLIPFTTEEIYDAMPSKPCDTLFLATWYDAWPSLKKVDMDFWDTLQKVRNVVNRAIETARDEGKIGSSLEAKIVLYAKPSLFTNLSRIENELRFVFITSGVILKPFEEQSATLATDDDLGLSVGVSKTSYEKCARCWHRMSDIGTIKNFPDLCVRCAHNISGQDEIRIFA